MFKFERNMGTYDRIIRMFVGTTLIVAGPLTNIIPTDMFSDVILSIMGCLAIISAALSYCFLYTITGFNTCSK